MPHAPHLIDAEVLHALRRRSLEGTLAADDALDAVIDWERLEVKRHRAAGHLRRVWSLRNNLTAYDALYVALAEDLGCPLVTGDGRLARAPGPRCEIEFLRT